MRLALPARLSPARWTLRWRLALVSSALTFVILLVFAAIVGRLAADRLEDDFRDEVEATANELAFSIRIDAASGRPVLERLDLERMVVANDATIRVIDAAGEVLGVANPRPLPAPSTGTDSYGELVVATRPLIFTASTLTPVYVQYARDHDELDATIERLWLLLGAGVGAGALLAALAGFAVARRAMRPIAALTAAAGEIASTRDPSRAMPQPEADDEIAELARTLDAMLAELEAAREESNQMVQAQREFVADASHELRTPLTSVLANLELLQEALEANPAAGEQREMVGSALRSSRRMRRLVGDLLLLARADAGRVSERRPCDLAEIAGGAVEEVRALGRARELELEAPEPVFVEGSADELHRAALNLLDNAVRHTPPGTRVEVRVRREGDDAILEVLDDGPGLPEGMEEQVFSRFVRGSGPADRASDAGTGLGLAIVRAVAGSHGGSVTAGRSSAGGAAFTVRLPASPGARERPEEQLARTSG